MAMFVIANIPFYIADPSLAQPGADIGLSIIRRCPFRRLISATKQQAVHRSWKVVENDCKVMEFL